METLAQKIAALPHSPGVYVFTNHAGTVVYVGKAIDIAKRVRQYFYSQSTTSIKTQHLVKEIHDFTIIRVSSEFDALLLEAKLIRQYMPKYNVVCRDDTSYIYLALTVREPLPRVLFLRRNQLQQIRTQAPNAIYGPFQSARVLRTLLSYIRRSIPFCLQKKRTGKPCFYTHIGLCTPCPSEIVACTGDVYREKQRMYRNNIMKLKAVFDGRTKTVIRSLEKTMHTYAQTMNYEAAGQYKKRRDALYSLIEKRYDPTVFLEQGIDHIFDDELASLRTNLLSVFPSLPALERIECFDISHFQGSQTVGSMVVVTNGQPDTDSYRKFRIRNTGTISDTACMTEVLNRRFSHQEWPYPQLILIDGGKPQVRSALRVIMRLQLPIPCIGLAKRFEEVLAVRNGKFVTLRMPLSGKAIKVLQRLRDEAHRFAITYHRTLRNAQNNSFASLRQT